jgi:recombinational DNA repair protein RecR
MSNTIKKQSEKMIKTVNNFIIDIEQDIISLQNRIIDFKNKIKICQYCNTVYIEQRSGRSKFCSDICRSNNRFQYLDLQE